MKPRGPEVDGQQSGQTVFSIPLKRCPPSICSKRTRKTKWKFAAADGERTFSWSADVGDGASLRILFSTAYHIDRPPLSQFYYEEPFAGNPNEATPLDIFVFRPTR